jgi:hypothetical protein
MQWLLHGVLTGVAYAGTGAAGVDGIITQFVTLILLLCGLALAGIIGFHGLRIAASHNFQGVAELMVSLAIGAGLIFGAKPLAAQVTGSAAGAVLGAASTASGSEFMGDLVGMVLFHTVLVILPAMTVYKRVRYAR